MTDDQEHCMKLAEPLLADFHGLWHHAFEQYTKYPTEFTAEHDNTTMANCIRSHAWTEVVRRFEGKKGFNLLRLGRLNLLLHRHETVWRFKLVDSSGRRSNYQTEQQKDYDDQLPLPGLPTEAVRLTSGYKLDEASHAIERIVVARPIGREIEWASQVNMDGSSASWEDITPVRLPGTERMDFRRRTK
jgi:hypothetical protein